MDDSTARTCTRCGQLEMIHFYECRDGTMYHPTCWNAENRESELEDAAIAECERVACEKGA